MGLHDHEVLFGNKFSRDIATFVIPSLAPHVLQGWDCERGSHLLFSIWNSLLLFSRLKDESRSYDKV